MGDDKTAEEPLKDSVSGKSSQAAKHQGPLKARSCTDIICLILFIATWITMLAIAIVAFVRGDPQRLLHGIDSNGRRCGFSRGVEDRPFLHFYDISRCATSLTSIIRNRGFGCNTPQVCVKQCPNANALGPNGPAGQGDQLYCLDQTLAARQTVGTLAFLQLIKNSTCAPYYLRSEVILGRCVPKLISLPTGTNRIMDTSNESLKDAGDNSIVGSGVLNSIRALARWLNLRSIGVQVWEDFQKTWHFSLGGLFAIIFISLFYILLISIVIGPLVYFSMFGTLALLIYGSYLSWDQYNKLKDGLIVQPTSADSFLDEYRYQTDTFLAGGIIFTSLSVIQFFICLFLVGRVKVAVAIIKESTKAMFAIKSTFFFPIFPALMQTALFSYFVAVGLYLVSSYREEYVTEDFEFDSLNGLVNCGFAGYDEDKVLLGLQVFHVIGWLWTANWVSALGQCVLAGAFASFYWTQNSKTLPAFPIMAALGRTLFYHTGSLAFGAAIITIIQIVRACLVLLERKLKEHVDKPAIKFILACLQCVFACVEKLIKFINKNAYIEIAVYGYNFCRGARSAFLLLLRNAGRTIAINNITSFILFLGRVIITLSIAITSYLVFDHLSGTRDLHYFLGPVIVLTFAAYLLSGLFMDTYDMGVDTIFLCALEDLEHHDGTPEKPYYMSKDLQKVLNVKQKPDSPQGSPKGSHKGSPKESPKGRPRGSPKGSSKLDDE